MTCLVPPAVPSLPFTQVWPWSDLPWESLKGTDKVILKDILFSVDEVHGGRESMNRPSQRLQPPSLQPKVLADSLVSQRQ